MAQWCQKIVASKEFHRLILSLIVLSGILVGFETYPQFHADTPIGHAMLVAQKIILWIFVVEAALKIAACGSEPWRYFMNPWNVFDFSIVAICFLPFGAQFAMVFRMARLLRAVRLLTALPRLQMLVNALLKSIPALGYVGILLLLHFYIYAVMGSFLFSNNDPIRFGNLQRSMMTLFQVLTLEGWNDVLNTQMLGSNVTYSEEWRALPEAANRISTPKPAAAAAYFVSFIMLGTMIMLNLFTGVIIGSMQEAQEQRDDETAGARKDDEDEQIKQIEDKGFMTLREELQVIAHHLRDVSADIAAIKEQSAAHQLESGAKAATATVGSDHAARGAMHIGPDRDVRVDERH